MTNLTDPNEVRLTGENSFIRLFDGPDGPMLTRVSHWRVLHSPVGRGHALFVKSDLIDRQVRAYSDNIALARWLQEEIEPTLFPEFANQSLPVISAVFSRYGDTLTYWNEAVETEEDTILLNWYDFMQPFMLTAAPGMTKGRPHGIYSCFVPARRAQISLNGDYAAGQVQFEQRGDWQSSTAVLAWSETWVLPKA
jgi:hypothetical protein